MTEDFQGTYFDGQSARPRPVTVHIEAGKMELTSDDSTFFREVVKYDIRETEWIGNAGILIHFGEGGKELLDIRSDEFRRLFNKEFPQINEKRTSLEKYAGSGWQKAAGFTALFVGIVVLIYFFVIPMVADLSARYFPKSYEETLGAMIYRNIIDDYQKGTAKGNLKVDSAKTALLSELADRIDFKTEYKLKIVVLRNEEKNAFAIPGGYIIVYSGIMKDMDDYPEMAGLLAHEVSHINKRHTLRSLFRSLSGYIFISLLFNDINGLTSVVLENADKIKTLSFSRSLEQEADLEGLDILVRNNIDPNGMVDLFKKLSKNDLPNSMEFLSTHPVTRKRIDYISEKIKKTHYTATTNSEMEDIWLKLKSQDKKTGR
jgi:beta-barrel assembly-enhancing protease